VKVIYIDNCCQNCNILRSIFSQDVLIKLDAFHWLECWNAILREPTKAQAAFFQTMMSQALFMIEQPEFERAKSKLEEKLDWQPTTKEIVKEANSIIPSPELLGIWVHKVFNYFVYLDMLIRLKKLDSTPTSLDNAPGHRKMLYLKTLNNDVQKTI
jgi:hypothetical protein